MGGKVSLFDRVITEFKREWNPETLKNTIDNKWDHVLIQAFFFNLGKKLGFEVGCEKFRKWDVAWVKDENYTQVEIELGAQTSIAKAFGKICRMLDALCRQFEKSKTLWTFSGILVIKGYLIGQYHTFEDYFFDFVLNPKEMLMEIHYPKNTALNLLVIDIERKVYRYTRVGPGRRYQNICTKSFSD